MNTKLTWSKLIEYVIKKNKLSLLVPKTVVVRYGDRNNKVVAKLVVAYGA